MNAQIASAKSHKAGKDLKGNCDAPGDSQHKPPGMEDPAWHGQFTYLGGVTARGPCWVCAASLIV